MAGEFFVKGEKIVLKSNGLWLADGIEITHDQTKALFYRAIHWKPKNFNGPDTYYLTVGYETIAIEVEDTPFFVVAVDCGHQKWTATLTDQETIAIEAEMLEYRGGSLYVNISKTHGDRINAGYPWARFLSAPYHALLSHLEEDAEYYFIAIPGAKNRRANLLPKGSAH
ncbi:MAG TPA: DUF1285 domain-containing protein [Oligoflexia bacterium]|nr:DUF1285 domain-containing protein [Oligoflexia bacterium]